MISNFLLIFVILNPLKPDCLFICNPYFRHFFFCIKSKSMSGLKRFQLTSSFNKRSADEFPSHPKQLSEVAKFNAPGIFFVRAKVADLQFTLYKACPLKCGGVPCKKKLDDEMFCRGCAHRANSPLQCLFLRVDLQDCEDPEVRQKVTIFSSLAEEYLAMRIEQFANMVEKCSEKLEFLLQSKLGQILSFKLNLKAKGSEFNGMDWIVLALIEEKAHNEDGEIIELDNDTGKKRAKKNGEKRPLIVDFGRNQC